MTDIVARRLAAHRLIGQPLPSPTEVVRLFVAVQAQDYAGAKWALGQRALDATDDAVDRLVDEGAILRTHIMRPTWHFVLPRDIRWLLDLTGARIRRGAASRYRQLELDDSQVGRAIEAFCGALVDGNYLTRSELGEVIRAAGISPEGQRLPHLLMAAELEGAIVSGPRRGKQHTYALLSERAPGAITLDRSEALAELTRRYFQSHGPAQVQDMTWWSGLTVTDIRTGLALSGRDLHRSVVEGKEYWSGPNLDSGGPSPRAHLLPNWDEYTVGYRDRSATLSPDHPFDPSHFAFGSILSNVVTVKGRVRGAWSRTMTNGRLRIDLRLLDPSDEADLRTMEEAGARLGRFLGLPADVAIGAKTGG
jgi:hypothetical protein